MARGGVWSATAGRGNMDPVEVETVDYVSLYRRWRPQKFAEVVGQGHVVSTLQRALARERLAHAYLFAGPRGTGKTSVARILAKAVNCRRGSLPEPCLECDLCLAIAAGSCLDVIEMDAASNRGIEEIRHLRENVGLSPAQGRKKVYIVDEAHMLTPEAFNALLKTLEEPPPHVLFVLATTEPHRLPLTIASRCQRFEFHRLAVPEIARRLREVVQEEGVEVSETTLTTLARYAEGSLRDAIGLLDQLLAYAPGRVSEETVWEALGRAPVEIVSRLAQALARRDPATVVRVVEEAAARGLDMRQVLRDLAAYLRDLAVLDACGEEAPFLYLPPGLADRARQDAAFLPRAQWWDLVTSLAQAEGEVRWTTQPRLALELVLLRLAWNRRERGTAAATENTAKADIPPQSIPGSVPSAGSPQLDLREAAASREGETLPPPSLETVWEEVLSLLRRQKGRGNLAAACLREGKPLALEGKRFLVGFSPQFAYHREQLQHVLGGVVEEALASVLGFPCRLVCQECQEAEGGVAPESAEEGREGTGGGRGSDSTFPVDEVVRRALAEFGGQALPIRGEDAK